MAVVPLFKGHDDLPDLASRFVDVAEIPEAHALRWD